MSTRKNEASLSHLDRPGPGDGIAGELRQILLRGVSTVETILDLPGAMPRHLQICARLHRRAAVLGSAELLTDTAIQRMRPVEPTVSFGAQKKGPDIMRR